MSELLSIALDVLVLAGLGVMIFYSFKLSRSLDSFRKGREEFGAMVKELADNIVKAETAMSKMKNTALSSGEDLQRVIDRSKGLIDELEIMNDAGDSLAERLEKLAEKNRIAAQELSGYDFEASLREEKPAYSDTLKKAKSKPAVETKAPSEPSFTIQDRDLGLAEEAWANDGLDDEVDNADDRFESQAERELYEALQKRNKR